MNRRDDAAAAAPASSEGTPSAFNDAGPATTTPGNDEQSAQHGKRAIVVASVLGALVVGGLLVDSVHTPSKAGVPAPEASRTAVPQDPFVDFEARQRMEAARLESEKQKKLAQEKARQQSRQQDMRDAAPGIMGPASSAPRSAEDEAREAARIDDLKHALAAVRSKEMLVSGARERPPQVADARGSVQANATNLRNGSNAPAANTGGTPNGIAGGSDSGSTLARLRLAIDRVRGGSANASGTGSPGSDAVQFVRDLRGPEASGTVVGQSATARRERGDAQRPGEYLIPVGTVMSAVLDMELNSDWEGRWRAMVTRDVYDLSQDVILIPKGTRVLGTSARPKPVNEAINERMALVAQWLVLPNGARIDLSRSAMLDGGGIAAIEGDVNHHYLATLGGVVAYGVIAGWGASQAAKSVDNSPAGVAAAVIGGGRTAGAEIALGLADIGKRVASRYLNLVPTITIKPGTPVNIFLDDEMLLNAWAPIDEFAPAVTAPAMR